MFEDSLFESTLRSSSARRRWTVAASIVTQALLASLLVILPLLHTEALPDRVARVNLAPPTTLPPPQPRTVVQRASSLVAAVAPQLGRMLVAPRTIPSRIDTAPVPQTAITSFGSMGSSIVQGAFLSGTGNNPTPITVISAPEKKTRPLPVSSGVVAGLLLGPIRPTYPQIAKAAHVEGTVVIEAVISKAGTIESLHVLSGPAMLQSAAIEAIRNARYRPYQLNGALTEVQTTITVNFHIGS